MNTGIKLKEQMWPKFVEMCVQQLKSGGARYALKDDKEFTDLVCEAAGNSWIGGNIIKYVGELLNTSPKPELNFPKIAIWSFIWWLKEHGNMSDKDLGEDSSHLAAECEETLTQIKT